MEELNIFAQRMRETRINKGLKQKELADKVSVTPQTISAYEKAGPDGKGKNPTLENAIAIAKVLDVSLDWLCGVEKDEAVSEYKTFGDIVKAIVDISDVTKVEVKEHIEKVSFFDEYEKEFKEREETHPAIIFENDMIEKFVKEWEQIRGLWNAKTIPDRLYRLWLDDKYKELSEDYIDWLDLLSEADDESLF